MIERKSLSKKTRFEVFKRDNFQDLLNDTIMAVKKLTIQRVINQVCPKCGNTGRCEPRTLSDPDGQECDCDKLVCNGWFTNVLEKKRLKL